MTQINLLPWRAKLKEQRKQEFFVILGSCLAITFFILIIVHMIMSSNIGQQISRNDYLQHEVALLDRQIVELRGLQQQKDRLITRMSIIQTLQINRPLIVRAFDELVKLLPDGVYLTSVKRVGQVITLNGRAQSNTRVSAFMRNIENSQWLTLPILEEIQRDDKQGSFNNIFVLRVLQKLPTEEVKANDKKP